LRANAWPNCFRAIASGGRTAPPRLIAALTSLKSQAVDTEDPLTRLYGGIEEGIVELDESSSRANRRAQADREKAQDHYHAASQMLPSAIIDPEKIAAFSGLMGDLLDNGETPARKAYLRTPSAPSLSVTNR
jgi:hypothetical protein